MKLLSRIEKTKLFWSLFGLSAIFFFLRFPSLFEPYWYGDEGVYEVIGKGITHGRLLYRDVWDNKPPMLYLLYGLVQGDLFGIRLLSLITGIFAVIGMFFLARKVLGSNRVGLLVTACFAILFGLPIIEGNIANAENFLILFSMAAGYLFFTLGIAKGQRQATANQKLLIGAGLLSGLSIGFKVFGLFDFAAFMCFIILVHWPLHTTREVFTMVRKLLIIIASAAVPLILSGIFFITQHAFSYFFESILSGNVSYVGVENTFIVPQGLLLVKVFLLVLFLGVIFWQHHRFTKSELFIALWGGFALFSAFFSQRPYTHYMLVLLPPVTLAVGMLFTKISMVKKRVVALLLIGLVIGLNQYFDHWTLLKTFGYYGNFLQFAQGKENVATYQAFFDPNTIRDYALADWITMHTTPHDTVFLWGNSPQVYALSDTFPPGRFSAQYHVMTNEQTIEETANAIRTNPPKYIIIMPDLPSIPFDMHNYAYKASLEGAEIYGHTL